MILYATPENFSTHCVKIEKRACLFSGRTAGKKVVRLNFMLSDWNVRPGTHIVQFGLHFNFDFFLFCSQVLWTLKKSVLGRVVISFQNSIENYKMILNMWGPPNFSFSIELFVCKYLNDGRIVVFVEMYWSTDLWIIAKVTNSEMSGG